MGFFGFIEDGANVVVVVLLATVVSTAAALPHFSMQTAAWANLFPFPWHPEY
jgi:hypothetical protein